MQTLKKKKKKEKSLQAFSLAGKAKSLVESKHK